MTKQESEEIDYNELRFKSGLEIHQQLDTGKLFCNCPSILRKDKPDYEVVRKLHAIAGESGEVDIAAKHQANLDKEFVYQGYDTTCLVELDEEPPHQINSEALRIALHIAFLMNMKPIPISQVMRKTVIDGSNTSGFQRTVLIAQNGYLDTKYGRVGIKYLYLEEDAARIVERSEKTDVYRLDRLGIPLVEIVTEPDVKTPEQAKEIALIIGDILRSCKVRRGIGSIRQDVNISIRGENRVEMKGMQDMKIFVKAIENEVLRQKKLSDENKPVEMEVRNVLPDSSSKYMRPLPGSSRMYPETDLPLLKIHRNFINEVKKTIPKLRSDYKEELKEKGLNEEMIKLLLKENKIDEFKELLSFYDNPKFIAKVLLVFPKEIAKHKDKSLEEIKDILNQERLMFVLDSVNNKKLEESQVKEALEKIVSGEKTEKAIEFEKSDIDEVEGKILQIIKEKPGLSDKAYMGLIMKEFKGKISGKDAIEIIRKLLK